MKLHANDLGLLKTEDGRHGIRRVNDLSWIIQRRRDPADPWAWEIIGHEPSQAAAVQTLARLIETGAP